jgi:hypothetical protein
MALDDIAPDVAEEELRGADDTAAVEQKTEVVEQKTEVKEETRQEETKEERVKYVPHEALHEARERAKEYRAKLEQMEREQKEYRASIEQKLAKLVNPPQAKPDFTQDPAGHLKAELDETREAVKPLAERVENFEKTQEQIRIQHEITTRTQALEAEFVKKNADYADAIAHLQKVAHANLEAMGVDDPVQRQALVVQQSMGLAAQALQKGKNPAEVAYQLAKNYGYQPKAKEAGEERKLETIKRGQEEASKSLGGGGGKQPVITLAELERMSEEDLDKLVENDAEWKKLTRQMQ